MNLLWISLTLCLALGAGPVHAQVEEGDPAPRRPATAPRPDPAPPAAVETALIETPAVPAGYGKLLRSYVVKRTLPGGAWFTVVDYGKLINDPMQERRRTDLRDKFTRVDLASMDARTRTAWAINAYNFFVIDLIVEHFLDEGGRPLASIRDIPPGEGKIFEAKRYAVAGKTYSLNQFERRFLFSKETDEATGRTRPVDPRAHFALVCAARGCPPLLPEPYTPEKLDKQLAAAAENALADPRHLRVEDGVVRVSQVFDWYETDFKPAGGVAAFLQRYAPEGVLPSGKLKIKADLPWDWSLNSP